eukprot:1109410-Pelagomonas_calceolata.AAC.1
MRVLIGVGMEVFRVWVVAHWTSPAWQIKKVAIGWHDEKPENLDKKALWIAPKILSQGFQDRAEEEAKELRSKTFSRRLDRVMNSQRGRTQHQPQPLHLLPRSITLVSSIQNRGTSILWRSNTVRTSGPRISWRPPSSSTAIYVAIFQGSELKSPSIPFCS